MGALGGPGNVTVMRVPPGLDSSQLILGLSLDLPNSFTNAGGHG
jgi:hypothetical protein